MIRVFKNPIYSYISFSGSYFVLELFRIRGL